MQWRRETTQGVEIEIVAQPDAPDHSALNAILDPPATAAIPDEPPRTGVQDPSTAAVHDEAAVPMDATLPAVPDHAAQLLLQVVSGAPVMAGGAIDVDVDPSAPEIDAQCAIASEEEESREQIIHRAIEYIKKMEIAPKASFRGMGQTALPAYLVEAWTNDAPNEFNLAWRRRTILIARGHFERNDPAWVQRINEDANVACDMLASGRERSSIVWMGHVARTIQMVVQRSKPHDHSGRYHESWVA
jgi:hypothetical protein